MPSRAPCAQGGEPSLSQPRSSGWEGAEQRRTGLQDARRKETGDQLDSIEAVEKESLRTLRHLEQVRSGRFWCFPSNLRLNRSRVTQSWMQVLTPFSLRPGKVVRDKESACAELAALKTGIVSAAAEARALDAAKAEARAAISAAKADAAAVHRATEAARRELDAATAAADKVRPPQWRSHRMYRAVSP